MIVHTIKTALRHLWKNKGFSLLNFAGLTIGLLASFSIATYIYHESTYDTSHPDVERTYRLLASSEVAEGDRSLSAINFLPITSFIEENVPEIESIARIETISNATLRRGNETFIQRRFAWADASLLNMLDIRFLQGTTEQALAEPNSVVITESEAVKIFGTTDPMGQMISVNGRDLTVTGVIGDLPSNTHLQIALLGSLHTFKNLHDPWSHQGLIYVKLSPHADIATVSQKINATTKENISWTTLISTYSLQNIKDIHLHSSDVNGSPGAVDIKYIYIFGIIGAILIFSTSFNYISLSIADFTARSQDFGIRKVLGSSKSSIMLLPVVECFFLCSMAAVSAILILIPSLGIINGLLGSNIDREFFFSFHNFLVLLGVFGILLTLSAIYPAALSLCFRPVQAFQKQGIQWGHGRLSIRNPLMALQFSIAIVLIISVITVRGQMEYLSSKRLGFEKDQVLVLKTRLFSKINAPLMKEQLTQLAGVSNATVTIGTPLGGGFSSFAEDEVGEYTLTEFFVDTDYIKTMGMNLLQGRDFAPLDSSKAIVNEAMVRTKGWEQPIGQKIKAAGKEFEVQAVIQDFHLNNIKTAVNPVVIRLGTEYTNNIILRLDAKNVSQTLSQIDAIWKELEPDHPLEYSFLDDLFDKLYQSETRFLKLSKLFSAIAVFIVCLGLYGSITYTTQRRIKEIGIRKVLGASVGDIVTMLSKDFVKLVLIAIVIASPIAWWAMNKWLADFAYRIDIEWWMFALAGLSALVIALLTISFQAIKTAQANPVDSLRDE